MRKWSLWIGLALLVLFGVCAYFMYFRSRFERNADLVGQLVDAEFVEEAPLTDGDWPQWRGLRRDGHAMPFPLVTEWPARGPKPAWTRTVGKGNGAPVVAAGRVYLHAQQDDHDVIRCVALDTGEEIWQQTAPPSGNFDPSHGPNSSPCVAGDRLYTVSLIGLVQCRATADGKLVWEKDLGAVYGVKPPRWGVSFSPLVEGDRLILNPGASDAAVVACKADTGEELWRSGGDPAGYSSPLTATIAGQRLVFMFTGNALTAMRLDDGKEVLRHAWPTSFQVNPAMPIVFHTRTGDKVRDYVFVTSGYDLGCGLLYLRPRDDGSVAVEAVYTANNFASHYGSPVRIGDHIYGFHETTLQALNLRTGEVRWQQKGYKKGSLCALGKDLVVLGEEGKLAIGPATPDEEFRPRLQTKVPSNRFDEVKYWTMPVVANGRLLVRSGENVLCYDLRANP